MKISVSAMSTRFQAMASSSCLFQEWIPNGSLVFEAEETEMEQKVTAMEM